MRVFLNHSTNKEILIVMAKLKDVLPPNVIEKMAIEYVINPVDHSPAARQLASVGIWDVNWNVFKNVCDDSSEYSSITRRFHTQRIKKWIKFCIDNMIKKNIFVQNNDVLRTLSFSDDYLSQMTSDFNLDENLLHENATRTNENLFVISEDLNFEFNEPAAIDLLKFIIHESTNDPNFSKLSFCELIYNALYDYEQQLNILRKHDDFSNLKNNKEFYLRFRIKTRGFLFKLIETLIFENVFIETDDSYIEFSHDYLTKETQDFNLDEAYRGESPYFSDDELREDIIDIITSFPDSTKGAIRHYLLEKPKYYRFLKFKEFTNMMYARIIYLIDEMIDAHIISCDAGHLGKAILTNKYLAKEIENFNLDESLRLAIRSIITEAAESNKFWARKKNGKFVFNLD